MARVRSKTVSSRKRKAPAPPPDSAERPLKIGEAAKSLGVEAYVLRFWETQFPFLRPKHSRSRHRFYGPGELETLKLIKRLLHVEGYTIAGARKHIREVGLERLRGGAAPTAAAEQPERAGNGASPPTAIAGDLQRALTEIREELRSLHKLLEG
jgi:DNA-binding transcriptional MerR regulator